MWHAFIETPRLSQSIRWCRHLVSITMLGGLSLGVMGCTAAVKQAAEAAAPAAVEEAVEEASEPSTRDAVAEILDDPDIRASSAQLSEAVTQGVVRGVETEIPMTKVRELSEAVAASLMASLAKSLERDVAPRMSVVVQRVIDESLTHAINEQTEARLQSVVATLTRATLAGATEALSGLPSTTTVEGHSDPLRSPSAQLSQNAWYSLGYSGANGFERAVNDAQLENRESSVLATIGTLLGWARWLPLVLLGMGGVMVLGLTAALAWALVALRRERRRVNERMAAPAFAR